MHNSRTLLCEQRNVCCEKRGSKENGAPRSTAPYNGTAQISNVVPTEENCPCFLHQQKCFIRCKILSPFPLGRRTTKRKQKLSGSETWPIREKILKSLLSPTFFFFSAITNILSFWRMLRALLFLSPDSSSDGWVFWPGFPFWFYTGKKVLLF